MSPGFILGYDEHSGSHGPTGKPGFGERLVNGQADLCMPHPAGAQVGYSDPVFSAQVEGKEQCTGGSYGSSLACFWRGGTDSLSVMFQGHPLAAPFLLTLSTCSATSGPRQWKQDKKGKLSSLMSHSPQVRRV